MEKKVCIDIRIRIGKNKNFNEEIEGIVRDKVSLKYPDEEINIDLSEHLHRKYSVYVRGISEEYYSEMVENIYKLIDQSIDNWMDKLLLSYNIIPKA